MLGETQCKFDDYLDTVRIRDIMHNIIQVTFVPSENGTVENNGCY